MLPTGKPGEQGRAWGLLSWRWWLFSSRLSEHSPEAEGWWRWWLFSSRLSEHSPEAEGWWRWWLFSSRLSEHSPEAEGWWRWWLFSSRLSEHSDAGHRPRQTWRTGAGLFVLRQPRGRGVVEVVEAFLEVKRHASAL